MSTRDIYNYIHVNDNLITGGQPTEAQIQDAAAEKFQIVINLATLNPRYSLPDEAGLVRSLGMEYYHIPVKWDAPAESDFEAFDNLMQRVAGKTLLHCAANYRATAFYSLYALKHLGWTLDQAKAFRLPIWKDSDYPIWEKLIGDLQNKIIGAQK